ncbi:hypothetical protein BJ138DRAFT_1020738, partial [Hygrophoropsis aurantiaca]
MYPGAAQQYHYGQSFLENFNADQFSEQRKTNLFYPFASKEDWQVGAWLSRSRLSVAAIDSFLSLPLIRTLPLSFRSAQQLRGRIELLPSGPKWRYRVLKTSTPTKTPVRLFWRDPLECIEALFNNPLFHNKLDLVPRRVYRSEERLVRVYSEWMTGDTAWDMQERLPDGATLLGVMLSSDKTTVSALTGDRCAHPLLIGLANIFKDVRLKASSNAFLLTALLPIPKFIHTKKRICGVLTDRLIHESLDIVLEPLKKAAASGAMLADPAGQDTIAQLGKITESPSNIKEYFKEAQKLRLNGVDKPFWSDYALADPYLFLNPEPLHYWHKFSWDHEVRWAINIVGAAEIDYRFSILHPATGFRQFKEGISALKKVTGRTQRDVQRYLVGVIAGCAPRGVVIAIRALIEFRYLGQAPEIDDNDCDKLLGSLQEFHHHKSAVIKAGGRRGKNGTITDWHIPKLELLQSVVPSIRRSGVPAQWSADPTEHAHVIVIKNPARGSNNNDYDPQICRFLDRTDRCFRFEMATSLQEARNQSQDDSDSEDGGDDNYNVENGDEDTKLYSAIMSLGAPSRSLTDYFAKALALQENHAVPLPTRTFANNSTAIHISRDPVRTRVLIDDVAEQFRIPDLRAALGDYLLRDREPGNVHTIGGQRRSAANCQLPFKHLQIWHKIRLQQFSFHDCKNILPAQT